jgi:putative ABC transport system permease protein
MTVWQLVFKEIHKRKLNFLAGLLSVIIAIAALISAATSLAIHDYETQKIISEKEAETAKRMKDLENDYRIIMKKLGFNLLILPEKQNLADLYADDFASKYMPEEYVNTLAKSNIMTIRHLLPSLQQRIFWNQGKRQVILIGTRGEVPFLHRDPKEPILVAVPKGAVVVGYELHQSNNLSVGDKIKIRGFDFTITQCNEERGNKDDITLWIDLEQAQSLLKRPGQVNAILALKCECAGNDISQIRAEVSGILPGTQVIEEASKVVTRAEARARAGREAKEAIESEKVHRQEMRNEQERFAAIYVPSIMGLSVLWIALLFLSNVRERQSEIGILRAIGLKASKILSLFLLKAAVMGLIGAILGILAGLMISPLFGRVNFNETYLNWQIILLAVALAPFISLLASWIPAFIASQQDPAVILSQE